MFFDDVDGGAAAKPVTTPASIICFASSRVLIPPEAFTRASYPTVFFMSATWRGVAPPVLKPVDVLTKSAPAFTAS